FDTYDEEVKDVIGEREIDDVVTFCFVETSGREENGGVTAVREETVVEEETECGGGGCR
ncbi:hypothetical protein A2U01_0102150, partial [Trifolium medium]|nr:hypothetical protein [Trifolium medium]